METFAGRAHAGPAQFSGKLTKPERGVKQVIIEGIPVEFPFEPYDCQRDYMGRVITALREGKNALLESPTGTGKTLCLLCASLAWRESLKASLGASGAGFPPTAGTGQQGTAIGLPGGMPGPAAGGSMPHTTMGSSGWGHNKGTTDTRGLVERELGVSVDPALAHLPPALQLVLSANAQHPAASGVISAAGTAGGGGGGSHRQGPSGPKLPTIVYSSRTHGQLAQVIKELQRSSYKDRVTSTVLSSRNQSCIHPKVSKLPGAAANQACRALTSSKKCGFYTNLKFGSRGKTWHAQLESPVADMEDLMRVGRELSLCPYYMARDAAKEADVVFMPYNYLLDPNIRKTMLDSVNWENAIVIFDEAHNVEQVCADSSSFDITSKSITDAMAEARKCREVCAQRLEQGTSAYDPALEASAANTDYRQLYTDLEILLGVFKGLEHGLADLTKSMGKEGLTRAGAYLFEFLDQSAQINDATLPVLNSTIDKATEALQAYTADQGGTANKNSTPAMQHLQECLNLAFTTRDPLSNKPGAPPAHKGYRVHVHMEKSWGQDKIAAPTLSFWCFIPGMAMRMLSALHLRSILLTSGTLAPLDSFAYELQLPFEVQLENPHIVAQSQVWVGVLQTGPMGHSLCSTYKERDNKEYKEDLGTALVNIARLVPDGLLVFFPSYHTLNGCLEYWKTASPPGGGMSIWERITRHKAPVVEPRDSALFTQAIEDYKNKLDDPGTTGAVFFAVCKGKVSEGLDFSDRAGRAVVITGIPYAMATDPKVRLKKDVLDEERRSGLTGGRPATGLSGEAWYMQSAMRAVNQAMGRVIRHRWDYGAVILADKRFGEPGTQKGLSKWLQSYVNVHSNFGSAAGSLTRFFKEKADFRAPTAPSGPKAAVNPFQVVGGSKAASGLTTAHRPPASATTGGVSLIDLVPSALDVTGLGTAAGNSSTGIHRGTLPASHSQSRRGSDPGPSSGDTGGGSGAGAGAGANTHKSGTLLRMLEDDERSQEPCFVADMAGGSCQEGGYGSEVAAEGADKLQALVQAGVARGAGSTAAAGSTVFAGRGRNALTGLPPPALAAGSMPAGGAVLQRARLTSTGVGSQAAQRKVHGRSSLALSYDSVSATCSLPMASREQLEQQQQLLEELGRSQQEQQSQQQAQSQSDSDQGWQDGHGQQQGQGVVSVCQPLGQFDDASRDGSVDGGVSARRMRAGSEEREHGRGSSVGRQLQEEAVRHQQQSRKTVTAGLDLSGLSRSLSVDRSQLRDNHPPAQIATGHLQQGPHGVTGVSRAVVQSLDAIVSEGVQSRPSGTALGTAGSGQGMRSAAGGPASSSVGPADAAGVSGVPKPNPKVFLSQLKLSLPAPLMQQVEILLKQYSSGKDPHRFMEGLVAALKGPKTVHHLHGFTAFLPRTERAWFTEVVNTHIKHYQQPPPATAAAAAPTSHATSSGRAPAPNGGMQQAVGRADTTGNRHTASSGSGRHSVVQVNGRPMPVKPSSTLGQGMHPSAAPPGSSRSVHGSMAGQSSSRHTPVGAQRPGATAPAGSGHPQQSNGSGQTGATGGGNSVAGSARAAAMTAAAAAGPSAVKRESAGGASAAKKPKLEGEACCMCGANPMDVAYSAPCGHTGCRQCWMSQIANHYKCAKCGREVRQKNLTRKFFG